ncbi:hypothetical protein PLESTB_000839200 [Pleodorina starrii]|uniref:Uncharacterized protein n=1 Tax=Pleodorina starrii TaxID=330485 RepID=A0A9W6BLZ8_9CHLO|nr:hypothetical protein PLESTM_000155000 [Pleodorina starrii]GLC54245.1 hypothetical protein PLESTB_000839200 [Pleodorina starrii]GLC64453.1 hypothetical protein PLESTF_000167600 [Pleodorina starrii]
MPLSADSSSNVLSTIISGDGVNSIQIFIALLVSCVGFVVAIVNAVAAYFRDKRQMDELAAQERRFEAFKKDLEDKQRRLVRYENMQELMKQYKKPLLQSAFDLQSRLANQIKFNFLYQFAQKKSDRHHEYARLNTAFVIAEFLGWLEVIRQEIVFIVGRGNQTPKLNLIIDAIKFQFTGDKDVQGNSKSDKNAFEGNWEVLQLFAGELRAIGEVMITERSYDDGQRGTNLSVIGYAEFARRLKKQDKKASATDKLHQAVLSPLLVYIDGLMTMDSTEAPTRRMAMLQVLLCKLIDVLDDAVPSEDGSHCEEPRYIHRDSRLTPLVSRLSRPQLEWLAEQPFMEEFPVEEIECNPSTAMWEHRMGELDVKEREMYQRLAFPGFREDLRLCSQKDREKLLEKDGYPGAFPPRQDVSRRHPPSLGDLRRAGSHRHEYAAYPAVLKWSPSLLRNRGHRRAAATAAAAPIVAMKLSPGHGSGGVLAGGGDGGYRGSNCSINMSATTTSAQQQQQQQRSDISGSPSGSGQQPAACEAGAVATSGALLPPNPREASLKEC